MNDMSEDNKVVYVGEVIWFSAQKGYGYLLWEKDGVQQKDMFLHYSDIVIDGFKTVYKGDRVSFSIGKNMRGEPKAIEVVVIKKSRQ
jgi:CspA family cold shock protein